MTDEIETHDPEHDALYLFNTKRHLPIDEQKLIVQGTLDFLDSYDAALQYKPFELTYMHGVWVRTMEMIEDYEASQV